MILGWYEQLVDTNNYFLFNKIEYAVDSSIRIPPHFHGGIELTLCTKGEDSKVVINGEPYPFTAGTVCFVNGFDIHQYFYKKGTERYVVVISPDLLKAVGWEPDTLLGSVVTDPAVFAELKSFLEIAERYMDGNERMMCLGFVGMLLSIVKKVFPTQPTKEKGGFRDTLINILQYVSSNSEKPLAAETVATHFGYTPNYFSSIFKRNTGVTFKEYLNFCRVITYKRLRDRDGKLSVAEAAERCGFGSVKSLYRACKRSGEMQNYYEV